MKKGVPKSVDEYIAAQPEAMRPKLEQVRAAIRRAAPEALEGIRCVAAANFQDLLSIAASWIFCAGSRVSPRGSALGDVRGVAISSGGPALSLASSRRRL
jgi:hypothetical protein